jgi:myosin-3
MAGRNKDFLPPEMVDTMHSSLDKLVKCLFTSHLSHTGNLIMSAEASGIIANTNKERWGAALIAGNTSRAQVKKLHGLILGYLVLHSTT